MNCCFLFNSSDKSKLTDTLFLIGKTKALDMDSTVLQQDISRTMPLSLDESENPLESIPSFSLLPQLKSDKDIESVLHQISQLLNSQSGTNVADINDSRSIEDILREAEEIVKDSNSYFDKNDADVNAQLLGGTSGRVVICRTDDKSDRTECSVELEGDGDFEQDVENLEELPKHSDVLEGAVDNQYVENETEGRENNEAEVKFNIEEEEEKGKENERRDPVNVSFLPITKPTSCLSPPVSLRTPLSSPRKTPPDSLPLSPTKIHSPAFTKGSPEKVLPVVNSSLKTSKSQTASPKRFNCGSSSPRVKSSPSTAKCSPSSSTPKKFFTGSIESTPPESPITKKFPGKVVATVTDENKELNCNTYLPPVNLQHGDDWLLGILDNSAEKMNEKKEATHFSTSAMSGDSIPTVHKSSVPTDQSKEIELVKQTYEEKITELENQLRTATNQLFLLESQNEEKNQVIEQRIIDLEEEVRSKDELIASYQSENQKLKTECSKATKCWTEAEEKLTERIKKLQYDLKRANQLNTTEALELREKLTDAREEIAKLEEENHELKVSKKEFESRCKLLEKEMSRIEKEASDARNELVTVKTEEREKARRAASESGLATANLQAKISQANSQLSKKQSEIVKLTGEMSRIRGELERARLGSVLGGVVNSSSGDCGIPFNLQQQNMAASQQVRQLEVALEQERDNNERTNSQLEQLNRHNKDLIRQVRELESIVRRRVKGVSGVPWSQEIPVLQPNGNLGEPSTNNGREPMLEQRNKQLEQLLATKDKLLNEHMQRINELQVKAEKSNIPQQMVKSGSAMSLSSGNHLNKQGSGGIKKPLTNQDAHLLATIRGLKSEVSSRDKQVMKLQKELEEAKKKKAPTTPQNKLPRQYSNKSGALSQAQVNNGNEEASTPSKNYNPVLYEDDREMMDFLKNENKNLRDEVKKLEQDLICLHNKRIQDLSEMEAHHAAEVNQVKRDISNRGASPAVGQISHLKGQIYTQQMVISHLKGQLKLLEERCQEVILLKTERENLQKSLTEANKRVACLHQTTVSPDNAEYLSLLEKVDELERRQYARESKLESLVKQFTATTAGGHLSSSSCCSDRIANKNREICYYRAEIDKMLDALSELKYS